MTQVIRLLFFIITLSKQTINKFGGRRTTIYENEVPYGLNVMHITKQPKLRENPCENSQCTHICALSGNASQCLCPVGMMLRNGNICKGKLCNIYDVNFKNW